MHTIETVVLDLLPNKQNWQMGTLQQTHLLGSLRPKDRICQKRVQRMYHKEYI